MQAINRMARKQEIRKTVLINNIPVQISMNQVSAKGQ
jgi:hypothetical protein